jgi:hypothetical protein
MLEKERADDNAGSAAEEHEAKRSPGYVATGDLGGHKDELDGSGKHESDADGDRRGHSEEENENGDGDSACADSRKRNE